MKISIIVIGRNEGWKLTQCLSSIYLEIKNLSSIDTEVIYVDSNSNDDSISRAKVFSELKVIRLTRDCSAAIARNVGAGLANNELLFFIDGDMELLPGGLNQIIDSVQSEPFRFFSGNLIYKYYNSQWKQIERKEKLHFQIGHITKMARVGGLFFITKSLWNEIGGMKGYLMAGEDIDLALRLSRKGVLLSRFPAPIVIHHTIDYLSPQRKWKQLFSKSFLHGKAVVFRENLLNWHSIQRVIRHDYSACSLLIVLGFIVLLGSPLFILAYLFIIIARILLSKRASFVNLIYFIFRDFILLLGIFLYYPRRKKIIAFELINSKGNEKIEV